MFYYKSNILIIKFIIINYLLLFNFRFINFDKCVSIIYFDKSYNNCIEISPVTHKCNDENV